MNIDRALASIQRIAALEPIPGADFIELAHIKGWTCIVKKGDFAAGDLCVFFEIDSFLPVKPEYEFLRKGCFKSTTNLGDGFRIKTMKMRGCLSQGLALPVIDCGLSPFAAYDEEQDVTEELGVQKYERPVPANMRGSMRGSLPSFIQKTDQQRIQNISQRTWENEILGHNFEVTLKLDGSSITVYKYNGDIGVCSRNINLKMFEDAPSEGFFAKVWRKIRGLPAPVGAPIHNKFIDAARDTGLLSFVERYKGNIAVQGELMGPGIQGNREGLSEPNIYVFDLFQPDSYTYMAVDERAALMMGAELPEAQHITDLAFDLYPEDYTDEEKAASFAKWQKDLLAMADRPSMVHPVAEGLVFKREDGQFSFKVINNNYLLNEKDETNDE